MSDNKKIYTAIDLSTIDTSKEKLFKKIQQFLFLPKEEAEGYLTETQLERRERWMFCISKKMENPMISDCELVEFLTGGCEGKCQKINHSTAYRDIASVSRLFGNIQLAAKSWYRYMIIEGAKKAYQIAETNRDARGMAAALDKIGKYTRADKPDDQFNWDKMIPPSFEPTSDPSILGDDVEIIENFEERRKELRSLFHSKKYAEEAKIIIDDPNG